MNCVTPASPASALWLVEPLALATRTEFGLGGSAGQEGQLSSHGVWFELRLCLEAGLCYQTLEFRIITALLTIPKPIGNQGLK